MHLFDYTWCDRYFWSSFDILQPCWSINVIIHDQPEHFPLGVDKRSPMVGVNFCSCDVDFCEISRII